jgi:hypothetical protein
MKPKQDMFAKMRDNTFYPVDNSLRARLAEGHSKSCLMPQTLALAFAMPKAIVDVEVSSGDGAYCWQKCDITDCPAYMKYS